MYTEYYSYSPLNGLALQNSTLSDFKNSWVGLQTLRLTKYRASSFKQV